MQTENRCKQSKHSAASPDIGSQQIIELHQLTAYRRGGLAFHAPETGHHFEPERRDFGAAATPATNGGNHQRLRKTAVHGIHQQPGASIGHFHLARRCGNGAQPRYPFNEGRTPRPHGRLIACQHTQGQTGIPRSIILGHDAKAAKLENASLTVAPRVPLRHPETTLGIDCNSPAPPAIPAAPLRRRYRRRYSSVYSVDQLISQAATKFARRPEDRHLTIDAKRTRT